MCSLNRNNLILGIFLMQIAPFKSALLQRERRLCYFKSKSFYMQILTCRQLRLMNGFLRTRHCRWKGSMNPYRALLMWRKGLDLWSTLHLTLQAGDSFLRGPHHQSCVGIHGADIQFERRRLPIWESKSLTSVQFTYKLTCHKKCLRITELSLLWELFLFLYYTQT